MDAEAAIRMVGLEPTEWFSADTSTLALTLVLNKVEQTTQLGPADPPRHSRRLSFLAGDLPSPHWPVHGPHAHSVADPEAQIPPTLWSVRGLLWSSPSPESIAAER